MNRLAYVMIFTTDLGPVRKFYEQDLGLGVKYEEPEWIELDTANATLGLHRGGGDMPEGVVLRLLSEDLDADMAAMRQRGVKFVGGVFKFDRGRGVDFVDPEGNLLSLYEPNTLLRHGGGHALGRVILNARNAHDLMHFYRDRLGWHLLKDDGHWIELDAGGAVLALHQRPADPAHPRSSAPAVSYTLECDDLDAWSVALRLKGHHFLTTPMTEEFGAYGELLDPEGRVVVLHEPPPPESEEEVLAHAFEDEDAPALVTIRKPVVKGTQAISFLVNKPGYKTQKKAAKKAAAAKRPEVRAAAARKVARAASVRGAGPEGARLKIKTLSDDRKPKSKPATGRLKKAERKVAAQKRRASATASRGKPVKRAAAKPTRGRAARTGRAKVKAARGARGRR